MDDITNDEKRLAEIAAAAPPKKKRAKKEEVARAPLPAAEDGGLCLQMNASRLAKALGLVRRAVGKSLPILECVKIERVPGMAVISLTAGNLDLYANATVGLSDGDVAGSGSLCVPAAAMTKLVAMAEGQIEVELDEGSGRAGFKTEGWEADLMGLAASEFPAWPGDVVGRVLILDLPQGVLRAMLRAVVGAVSKDEARYVLNGVLLCSGWDVLNVAATNGRVLAWARMEDYEGAGVSVILPRSLVDLLCAGMSAGDDGPVRCWVHRREREKDGKMEMVEWAVEFQVELSAGVLEVWGKVIEGDYPQFRQVVPAVEREVVALDGVALLEMVGRAAEINPEQLSMGIAQRIVRVDAERQDVGTWQEMATLVAENGGPDRVFALKVNPEYLGVMLASLRVRLDVGHAREMGPLVWRATESAMGREVEFTGVVMPLRSEGGEA